MAHLLCARMCCAISATLVAPPASCASSITNRQNTRRLSGVGTTAYLQQQHKQQTCGKAHEQGQHMKCTELIWRAGACDA